LECTSAVLFTTCRVIGPLHVLFMSGKGDVQADEELKDKRNSKVMSLSASGGAVYVGQQNEHYSGQIPL